MDEELREIRAWARHLVEEDARRGIPMGANPLWLLIRLLVLFFDLVDRKLKPRPAYSSAQVTRFLATADKRAVLPFVTAMDNTKGLPIHHDIVFSLTRLLRTLESGDQALLDADLCDRLERVLRYRNPEQYADLQIAILAALQQVGRDQALPIIREIVKGKPRSPDAVRVRTAALECLDSLEQVHKRVLLRDTLVRPSTSVDAATDTLLRPASGTSATTSESLMRPSPPPTDRND